MANFFHTISNFFSPRHSDSNTLSQSQRRRLQKKAIQLQRSTDALCRRDIADWRTAWQLAIRHDEPSRRLLYDIYRDVDVDLHLSGCVNQRRGMVLARSFKLVNPDGSEDSQALRFFDKVWFKQFLRLALDSIFWGHSLIELGNVITDEGGSVAYDGVTIIPRAHVIPEYGRVVREVGQSWHQGIDYRQPPFSDWLVEAGAPDDLGLYLKAATQTIPKKHALAFWDTFAEIFGMPMRIARTSVRDENELSKMEQMMSSMGTEFWGIFQEGTDIEVKESSRGDAFNVYDRRIDRANSELSKLIIGQTMTIEDGSSLSQSETHLHVMQDIIEADCDFIRDIINGQLIPRMIRHGFPLQGLSFEWDYSTDYTPEQQVAFETLVLNNYEVDGQYFAEKYGMPVGARRALSAEAGEEGGSLAHQTPFFD